MSETLPITEARARFGSLVRRTAHARERITITDHGQAATVFINPRELAELEERVLELEEQLAVAQYRAEKAAGTFVGVPHEEVGKLLGLERE
ncbi:type II toxin-antitoxin system prevent-host-death family antitoxin [Streptomyces sp. SID8379]|uniref:type II toxin-antitoxin system prevent-host-death family antitoxin n=1 Tax=unclassified Streptomyces TaxID=2593676 RepID=UPI000372F4E9|nr:MULTISPECIES: type II toxin-antitoxin system prevent-host-death family antitoxin [unclassified Streptomyces]MYW69166.1 type II toxin-antitoxin system prevent-host-death family antitoxin [Streptomyces sp. SID8379]